MNNKTTDKSCIRFKKSLMAGLVTSIVIASVILVVPDPVEASGRVTDECSGTIKGGTHVIDFSHTHKKSCSFECNEEDYIAVEVISREGRGKVSIVGTCQGARAECTNETRECSAEGGPLARRDGTGECRAQVDHYNKMAKEFRCQAISMRGEYQDSPIYAFCVVHWLGEWILGGNVADDFVEVCLYEGNAVCVDILLTFRHDATPWVVYCGTDAVSIVLHDLCTVKNFISNDDLCFEFGNL